jgi:predicted SpoU family rRNA methylase
MKRIVLIASIIFFQSFLVVLNGSELKQIWQKPFGGDKDDIAYGVSPTDDGGFCVVGSTRTIGKGKTDAIVLKMDKSGKILWKKVFGKEKKELFEDVVETADKSIVAVGSSKSYSKSGNYSIFVVKLSKDADVIWIKSFGGDGKDYARAVCNAEDGAVVIVGATKSYGKGSYDFFVTKLDKDGKIVWSKTYGGEDLDAAYAVESTKDGGFIIAGATESYGSGNSDYYIVKIDSNGKELWSKTIGGKKEDTLYGVKELKDGYVFVGESRSYGSQKRDLTVLKTDKNGNEIFHKFFGYKNHEYARAVELTDKGDILVAGVTKSMGHGRADFYLLELDSKNGKLINSVTFGGKKNDYARGMTKLKDGSFVVVGESESFNEDAYDFHMINISYSVDKKSQRDIPSK